MGFIKNGGVDMAMEIALRSRGSGNTTYLLKACLHNPRVTVVCSTGAYARQLQRQYLDMYWAQSWWVRKVWGRFRPRDRRGVPKFIGSFDALKQGRGHMNIPVVFDNSALL